MIINSFKNVAAIGFAGLPALGAKAPSTMKKYVNTSSAITLTDGMNGGLLIVNSGSPVTISVPASLSNDFYLTVLQYGAGTVTFTGTAGATVRNRSSQSSLAGRYALGAIVRVSNTSDFVLGGDTV
jgi:hypothetical protein